MSSCFFQILIFLNHPAENELTPPRNSLSTSGIGICRYKLNDSNLTNGAAQTAETEFTPHPAQWKPTRTPPSSVLLIVSRIIGRQTG
ncbi:hypothetical protein QUF72_18080 [Desulfobacterales bacterium HSG2]|nr:hypothetical protein [Desulfobacterales bacterium HSG2]